MMLTREDHALAQSIHTRTLVARADAPVSGTIHIATINAYPIKDSLGGGYRGVMLIKETRERRASKRFDTLQQATYWAKNEAHNTYSGMGYKLAPVSKSGEYYANVWVAAK